MNPRLILINGAPASGKTTLAREWCERHAATLPLCMDVDTIRSMLGGWRDALQEAGLAARDLAIAAVQTHLESGRDVVVPQYLRRPEFIDRLEETANAAGARFVETALVVDAATAEGRFTARADSLTHADPHGALPAEMADIVREFDEFLATRESVIRIASGPHALASLEAAVSASRRTLERDR
ncbi:AAA family ATPase [Planctomonas sp. JC2975]|uniref:AAA family ATPase n=1 Tax=Planctomonas sp. JC2975 TaxID=2729626 RepID=UPI001474300D|nr:AAA family ATPase [Planctomonas sp. JC2975]